VYGLQIRQLVIIRIDAGAEEQARVPSVHDLVVAELDEIRLVLLVAGRDEAVHLLLRQRELERLGMKGGLPRLSALFSLRRCTVRTILPGGFYLWVSNQRFVLFARKFSGRRGQKRTAGSGSG
jgi:hypothetical protein